MRLMLIPILYSLGACGGEPADTASELDHADSHLLETQIQAMDKARSIEKTLNDSAQQRLDEADQIDSDG